MRLWRVPLLFLYLFSWQIWLLVYEKLTFILGQCVKKYVRMLHYLKKIKKLYQKN